MVFEFQFSSLSAFWHMQGHGVFVWSVYAIAAVLIGALVLHTCYRRKTIIKDIHTIEARARRREQAESGKVVNSEL